MIELTTSSNPFQVLPKGENVLQITNVEYKQTVGQMRITLANKDGVKHTEVFRFITKAGKRNNSALNVFSYFAHVAFNDFSLNSIDEQELVGKFVKCTVEHDVQPNINDPEKTVTFVRLNDFKVASGFESNKNEVDPLDEI